MASLDQGQEFGSYTLHRRLARGGMGEIWLAERKGISGFSKRVVIKTILECFVEEPELVEMFLQEGRVAAGLDHPNIAQTHDLGQVGEIYYIAMEYVQGRDVRNLMLASYEQKQLIPLNLVLRIASETCRGLYHAHTYKTPDGMPAGIVHRDISPQNILVTFDGGVKIVDFGIARAIHKVSKTRSGVLKGKYAYMSPEQIKGASLDGRSDLFSLGVVMFEMLTGRRLFKRDSDVATLDAVLQSQIPPPNRFDVDLPKAVEQVLLKSLKKEPGKRYQDGQDMQLALEEVTLSAGLPASSAHLSAYMRELFGEVSDAGQDSANVLAKGMEALPGPKEAAPALARSTSYSPGAVGGSLKGGAEVDLRSATRMGFRAKRRGTRWVLILVALVVIGGGVVVASIFLGEKGPAETGNLPGVTGSGREVSGAVDGGASPDREAIADPGRPDAGTAGQPTANDGNDEISGSSGGDAIQIASPERPGTEKPVKPDPKKGGRKHKPANQPGATLEIKEER